MIDLHHKCIGNTHFKWVATLFKLVRSRVSIQSPSYYFSDLLGLLKLYANGP